MCLFSMLDTLYVIGPLCRIWITYWLDSGLMFRALFRTVNLNVELIKELTG